MTFPVPPAPGGRASGLSCPCTSAPGRPSRCPGYSATTSRQCAALRSRSRCAYSRHRNARSRYARSRKDGEVLRVVSSDWSSLRTVSQLERERATQSAFERLQEQPHANGSVILKNSVSIAVLSTTYIAAWWARVVYVAKWTQAWGNAPFFYPNSSSSFLH